MLYIVATPIGNLDDITLRALKIFKEVDFIACEDTRRTGILLKHFGIKKPLISYYEYNEENSGKRIISLLKENKNIALVSDGGTPAISDPGFRIVSKAIEEGLEITAIPGATAFVNALVISGLPVYSFIFRGFPPHKEKQRCNFLSKDKDSPYTLIYYESPYRLEKFLTNSLEIFGDRKAVVAKDLTKLFETMYRGTISQILEEIKQSKIRGEYIILIEGLAD